MTSRAITTVVRSDVPRWEAPLPHNGDSYGATGNVEIRREGEDEYQINAGRSLASGTIRRLSRADLAILRDTIDCVLADGQVAPRTTCDSPSALSRALGIFGGAHS